MASRPNTWGMLQALQWRIQNEVTSTATPGGLSYFTPWNETPSSANPGGISDYARYSPNSSAGAGLITNAIYLGFPKDFTTSYKMQCAIIPNDDMVIWRSNPRVFDELNIYLRCWFYYKDDWFSVMQTALAVRDQLQVVIQSHAELPAIPEVQAVKQKAGAKGLPAGFFFDDVLGGDWLCYATTWWHRQEWTVPGGLIGA
jgi:hypothetical protein